MCTVVDMDFGTWGHAQTEHIVSLHEADLLLLTMFDLRTNRSFESDL